jgi:hypothetical protein
MFFSSGSTFILYSNMTSFFRLIDKRAIYRFGIISLAHAPVHVTDFSVVNVHVDKLSSTRIWQYKLCATLPASVNINYRLPIKVHYRICTLRHIRIEIIHGNQNVFWVLHGLADTSKFYPSPIYQHVHLRRKSQSHAPAHMLMRLYPIDNSLVWLQS